MSLLGYPASSRGHTAVPRVPVVRPAVKYEPESMEARGGARAMPRDNSQVFFFIYQTKVRS